MYTTKEYLPYEDPTYGQIWEPYVDYPYQSLNDKDRHGSSGLKYYLIRMALRLRIDAKNEIRMSLNQLMEECGYQPSYDKPKIKPFREGVREFVKQDGVSCDVKDWDKVTPSQVWTIRVDILRNPWRIEGDESHFIIFQAHEFHKIIEMKDKAEVSTAIMAGVYLLIKSYSQPAYPSKQTIAKRLGISDKSARRAIAALEEAVLIRQQHYMYQCEDGTWSDAVSAYTYDLRHYLCDEDSVRDMADRFSTMFYGGRPVKPKEVTNAEERAADAKKTLDEIYSHVFIDGNSVKPDPKKVAAAISADLDENGNFVNPESESSDETGSDFAWARPYHKRHRWR